MPEETCVQLTCVTIYDIWCRDLDTHQISTERTCGRTEQNGKKYMLNFTHKNINTNIWVRERTNVIAIQSAMWGEWGGPGHGTSTASKTTDGPRVSQLEDHTTRHDSKGDQTNVGETTWHIQEGHDLAEDIATQANLEMTCWSIRPTSMTA